MVYEWGSRKSFGIDPNQAGAEIERIALESQGGAADSASILEAARPEDSVLHPAFTWEDYAAAEAWRREEARRLVGALVVVQQDAKGKEQRRPAFYHVAFTRSNGEDVAVMGYQPISVVVQNEQAQDSAAADLLRHLRGLQARHRALAQFEKVWREVDRVAEEIAA